MWSHLQPHKSMTDAVLIAKPKYNWVMRNKFIVHWLCLRIPALDVCVLQIINKIDHAHTPICAKRCFLAGVKWGGKNVPGNKISVHATVYRKTVKCGLWVCLSWLGLENEEMWKALTSTKPCCAIPHPAGKLQSQVLLKPKSLPVSAPVCGMSLCWTLLQTELENSHFHSCDVCNTNQRNFWRTSKEHPGNL